MDLTKPSEESPTGNPLMGLLSRKVRFQLVVSNQLLQLPMHQGHVDLEKISPIKNLDLGDVFHAIARKEITKTHQKGTELINEVVKSLQDVTPDSSIDIFFSTI